MIYHLISILIEMFHLPSYIQDIYIHLPPFIDDLPSYIDFNRDVPFTILYPRYLYPFTTIYR